MFCAASMRITLVVLVVLAAGACGKASRRTNNISEETKAERKARPGAPAPAPAPAIVAIEIIDPNENKTSKNSKRTIESSLGYGYQSFFGPSRGPPRFQIYKYSQHDIPARPGALSRQNFQIQKSVSYDLPTQTYRYTSIRPSLVQYYKPGTTLYSTLDQRGQLAGLSPQIPYQQGHAEGGASIPVIILRVHPESLRSPGAALYPKLPHSNPYASKLNNVDIQGLLSNYIENMLRKIKVKTAYPAGQEQQQQQQQYVAQAPGSGQPGVHYLPATTTGGQQTAQYLPPPADHYQPEPALPEAYQQVDYRQEAYQQADYQHAVQQQPAVYQEHSQAYQQQAYQQPTYPDQEYRQQAYVKYSPPAQYHREVTPQQGHEEERYSQAALLTHENYPDDTHTRVIFRTKEGHIKTTTRAPTETKVIKISVPDSSYQLSSVEVKTPETHYAYTPGPDLQQVQQAAYESAGQAEPQPQFYYIAGGQDYQTYQQQAPAPPHDQEPVQYTAAHQQQQQQQQQDIVQYSTVAPAGGHHQPETVQYAPSGAQQQQQLVQYVTPRVVVQPRGQPPSHHIQPTQHKRRSRSKKSRRIVRPTSTVKHVTEQSAE